MTVAADVLIGSWSTSAAPPPDMTISEWSDENRRLPEASAARGARWRTADVPYIRGIQDAPLEPGVRKIAVMKASQTAGSEALHNILGYHIEYDPCAMLFVHPTSDVAQSWSKDRLADMIRSSPPLRSAVKEGRQPKGEPESTLALKVFPGGYLALGGANTANTFARWSVRIAYGDDVDRFPPVIGEEGDPLDLLENRTSSFLDRLLIAVSTPTLKNGRIDTLYQRSDQRRYFVPCLRCGRLDYITWNDPKHFRIAFDARDAETARLECPSLELGGCGGQMNEAERRAMIAEGAWQATATPKEPGLVGFHLPAMISTLGDVSLSGLVAGWLAARAKGRESLRVFVNTKLAEGWEDRGARVEAHGLLGRRESYGDGIDVPAAAVALTAGVDVQIDRFELQVQAWGPGQERWVVDWRSIPGDPKKAETQAALLEALGRRYLHASGHALPILSTCLDTGYATEEMYDFVLSHQVRRIYATKGFADRGGTPIVGAPSEKRYGKRPRPVRLWPVNVDDAKTDVIAATGAPSHGPGSLHFPMQVDEEFFAQLCAEHRETRYNKANVATHTIWVQDRERNEALDTAVLCLAAFKLLNPNVKQMAGEIAATPVPVIQTAPASAPPPAPAAPPARRSWDSGYLD